MDDSSVLSALVAVLMSLDTSVAVMPGRGLMVVSGDGAAAKLTPVGSWPFSPLAIMKLKAVTCKT